MPIAIRNSAIASMMLDQAHQHVVDPAAEEAGDRAEDDAEEEADRHGDDPDQEREARAVEDAGKLVTTEIVDAQQVMRRRAGAAAARDQVEIRARGSLGASSGANSATRMKSATSTKPMMALGFRLSRRNASDQSPPCPFHRDLDRFELGDGHRPLPPSPDARVDQRVRDVHQQVHEHDDDRHEQDAALDHGVVAVGDRLLQPRADPRIREDRLREDRAGEQQPDLEADDRRDGKQRVPQHVPDVHGPAAAGPWRAVRM